MVAASTSCRNLVVSDNNFLAFQLISWIYLHTLDMS